MTRSAFSISTCQSTYGAVPPTLALLRTQLDHLLPANVTWEDVKLEVRLGVLDHSRVDRCGGSMESPVMTVAQVTPDPTPPDVRYIPHSVVLTKIVQCLRVLADACSMCPALHCSTSLARNGPSVSPARGFVSLSVCMFTHLRIPPQPPTVAPILFAAKRLCASSLAFRQQRYRSSCRRYVAALAGSRQGAQLWICRHLRERRKKWPLHHFPLHSLDDKRFPPGCPRVVFDQDGCPALGKELP